MRGGLRVHGVPRLGRPDGRARGVLGIGAEVDDAARLDRRRDELDRQAVLRRDRVLDLDVLLVDLGAAVLLGGLVAPLAQREVRRVAQPRVVDLAREAHGEAVGLGRDERDLEDLRVGRPQALQSEARVAPVPVAARAVLKLGEELTQVIAKYILDGNVKKHAQRNSGTLWLASKWQPEHLRLIYETYQDKIVDLFLKFS